MAFFDDLGKKITQTGQSAVQKTKDMTDIAKLNNAISEEERKINAIYFQIGQLYAAMHSSDYEDVFAEMVLAIHQAKEKINDCHQQILNIKGVIRCERCGAEVSDKVAFCSSCGSPVPKKNTILNNSFDENMMRCDNCGQALEEGSKFCIKCGRPVKQNPQTHVSEQIISTTPSTNAEPVEKNKCPNCGADIQEGFAFCIKCGVKI